MQSSQQLYEVDVIFITILQMSSHSTEKTSDKPNVVQIISDGTWIWSWVIRVQILDI